MNLIERAKDWCANAEESHTWDDGCDIIRDLHAETERLRAMVRRLHEIRLDYSTQIKAAETRTYVLEAEQAEAAALVERLRLDLKHARRQYEAEREKVAGLAAALASLDDGNDWSVGAISLVVHDALAATGLECVPGWWDAWSPEDQKYDRGKLGVLWSQQLDDKHLIRATIVYHKEQQHGS